ncbi:hypothetical protein C8R47DRAFT_1106733 [Mycena vitilis]|nr:hypothetical protein C8R47DRAFT_1106733 [Mycena vitilis]
MAYKPRRKLFSGRSSLHVNLALSAGLSISFPFNIMSFHTPDLAPTGLVDIQGDYILDTPDVFNLLKYLWTGMLLATTAHDYRTRTGITIGTYNKYKALLDPLITDHIAIKGHCTAFQNGTYKDIVAFADSIYDYADQASGGGNPDASYYKVIFDTMAQIAACKAADPQVATLVGELKDGVEIMVGKIDDLLPLAEKVVSALATFVLACNQDALTLEAHMNLVTEQIDNVQGDVERLQLQIKQDIRALADAGLKLTQDENIFWTASAFGWIAEFGTTVATTALEATEPELKPVAEGAGHVAGEITDAIKAEYAEKVKALSASVDSLQKQLKCETQQLQEDTAIVAQLSNVKLDIETAGPLVQRVHDAIAAIIVAWKAIRRELLAVQDTADKDIASLVAAYSTATTSTVLKKWNDLEKAVDSYRKGAYISAMPTITTLDEYANELAKCAKAVSQ